MYTLYFFAIHNTLYIAFLIPDVSIYIRVYAIPYIPLHPPKHSSLIAKNQTRSINYSKRVDCLGKIITRKLIRNATPAAICIVPQMTNKVCHVPRTTQNKLISTC